MRNWLKCQTGNYENFKRTTGQIGSNNSNSLIDGTIVVVLHGSMNQLTLSTDQVEVQV